MAKLNVSREEKFRESLKERNPETRPFIRTSINEELDKQEYEQRKERIRKMKEDGVKETGDDYEHVHVWVNNNLESFSGMIKDWDIKEEEENE